MWHRAWCVARIESMARKLTTWALVFGCFMGGLCKCAECAGVGIRIRRELLILLLCARPVLWDVYLSAFLVARAAACDVAALFYAACAALLQACEICAAVPSCVAQQSVSLPGPTQLGTFTLCFEALRLRCWCSQKSAVSRQRW
jgi:hypothetical protein